MPNAGYIIFRNRAPRPKSKLTAREYLKETLDAKPETAQMQRVKFMTREERARGGIESLTRDLAADEKAIGKLPDVDKIRHEVEQIAETAENKKDRK